MIAMQYAPLLQYEFRYIVRFAPELKHAFKFSKILAR